ncbi:hypothetical protein [Geminocystis sp. GBBB08]|uniref:hypothetical protein n=1 Tax=Geminocystis sp. GBBB08 TaxID=2604140 RepID=UPI0027E36565|nr:hypothetical protein [Geminocystis sp. GBBB08]MBL1209651.1 hypothetical protein [Geminocystis sp. GBBB08]
MLLATISEKINNGFETSKNFVKNVGDKVINTSNNLTNSAVDTFNNTKTAGKTILTDSLNQASNIADLVSNNIQSSLESLWNNWVTNHYAIAFLVSHPLTAIVLLITAILTIWGLIQMIPSLFVNFWLMIFKSPFIIGKSLLKNNSQGVISANNNPNLTLVNNHEKDEFLKQILAKLDAIESEQKNILQQLAKIQKDN